MAARMSCPHCKASYRFPADYHGQAVRCNQCNRLFRVRLLDPVMASSIAIDDAAAQSVESRDATDAANAPSMEERDLSLIPFEDIEPPCEPFVLPLAYDDLLPIEPPTEPHRFPEPPPFVAGDPPLPPEPQQPTDGAPLVLELAENPPMPSEPPSEQLSSRSLLDLIDLTLPVEPYLPAVEADSKSLLDSLDLTLPTDPAESEPLVLEAMELSESAPVELELVSESSPLAVETQAGDEMPVPERERANADHPSLNPREGERKRQPESARDETDWGESRAPRHRPVDRPRRSTPQESSNWLVENRGPITLIAGIVGLVITAILIVNLMDGRKPSRSVFASDERRQPRFEPPQWQPEFQPPPPVMIQPVFPERDPRFDPPGNDVKKPFAQPPEPKRNTPEPKKPRAKSKLPQEKRDWIALNATAVNVDSTIGMPRIDSKPVELAAKGTTYNYLLDIHIQTNEAKALLEFAPPGMKLQSDARLIWEVPPDFPENEADIAIRIRQSDDKECVQTFVISIR